MQVSSNYGINCRFGTSGGIKMGTIAMPAQIYYVACGLNAGGGWWRGFKPPFNTCTGTYYREVHNGGINIGMVDGHAKWIKSDVAFADLKTDWDNYGPWSPTATVMCAGR